MRRQSSSVKSDARLGTPVSPKSILHTPAVLKWWRYSTMRMLAIECGMFPLRILAALRVRNLRFGPAIPMNLTGQNGEILQVSNTFLRGCTESKQRLSMENSWVTAIDLQLAARGFQEGASPSYTLVINRG